MNIYILKSTMYKKYIIALFGVILIFSWLQSYALKTIWGDSDSRIKKILTTDNTTIITPPDENVLMEGTHTAVESEGSEHIISNISNSGDPITTQEKATEETINMIHRFINRTLALLSFVALIVLLIWGFQVFTAAGDDSKLKKWKSAIKKVAIGLAGIWVSWLIVSMIFRFIRIIT